MTGSCLKKYLAIGMVGLLWASTAWAEDSEISSKPLTDRERAQHVLDRLSFGPRPGEVEQVMAIGWRNWINQQLSPEEIDNDSVRRVIRKRWPSLGMSMAAAFEAYRPPYAEGSDADRDKQRKLRNQLRAQIRSELVDSVLYRAVYSKRRFEEVIVEFWRNHFNVDHSKDDVSYLANHYEQQVIRRHAFGKFEHFLLATAQHPAMLIYLDNIVSQKPLLPHEQRMVAKYEGRKHLPRSVQALGRHRGLNENYARELMELHTLGVDRFYTQHDVIDMARILTGWTAGWIEQGGSSRNQPAEYGFIFRKQIHDLRPKQVLGIHFDKRGGVEEGRYMVRALAHHPGTAEFISRKLCQYLVSDQPSEALVENVTMVFKQTRGDLPKVYEAILLSDEFIARHNYQNKFKTPFEFTVSTLRATDANLKKTASVHAALSQMGQPIYRCVDPTGYGDQAEAWLDPGVLIDRWRFALNLAAGQVKGVKVPDSYKSSWSHLSEDELFAALSAQLLPESMEPDAMERLRTAVQKAPDADIALGLILGSPMFQQQ